MAKHVRLKLSDIDEKPWNSSSTTFQFDPDHFLFGGMNILIKGIKRDLKRVRLKPIKEF